MEWLINTDLEVADMIVAITATCFKANLLFDRKSLPCYRKIGRHVSSRLYQGWRGRGGVEGRAVSIIPLISILLEGLSIATDFHWATARENATIDSFHGNIGSTPE